MGNELQAEVRRVKESSGPNVTLDLKQTFKNPKKELAAVAKILQKNAPVASVRRLDLSSNMIGDTNGDILCSVVSSPALTGLERVLLSNCQLGSSAFQAFKGMDKKRLGQLVELDLSRNDIDDSCVASLDSVIFKVLLDGGASNGQSKRLDLKLVANKLTSNSMSSISNILKCVNTFILDGNAIKDEGALKLASQLQEILAANRNSNNQAIPLVISVENNGLTESGLSELLRVPYQCGQNWWCTINAGEPNNGLPQHVRDEVFACNSIQMKRDNFLKIKLLLEEAEVKQVNMAGIKLFNVGVKCMAEKLQNAAVEAMDLTNCAISVQGLHHIISIINSNAKSIHTLLLDGNEFESSHFGEFSQALAGLQNLTNFSIDINKFSSSQTQEIFQKLASLRNLKELTISLQPGDNPKAVISSFGEFLSSAVNLESLTIKSDMGDALAPVICNTIHSQENKLTKLDIHHMLLSQTSVTDFCNAFTLPESHNRVAILFLCANEMDHTAFTSLTNLIKVNTHVVKLKLIVKETLADEMIEFQLALAQSNSIEDIVVDNKNTQFMDYVAQFKTCREESHKLRRLLQHSSVLSLNSFMKNEMIFLAGITAALSFANLTHIDLSNNEKIFRCLSSPLAAIAFGVLEKMERLESFDLSNCGLGINLSQNPKGLAGWEALLTALKKHKPVLKSVCLANNTLLDEHMTQLFTALLKIEKTVDDLKIESEDPTQKTTRCALENLDVSGNEVERDGIVVLGKSIENLLNYNECNMQRINICNCGYEGTSILQFLLNSKKLESFKELVIGPEVSGKNTHKILGADSEEFASDGLDVALPGNLGFRLEQGVAHLTSIVLSEKNISDMLLAKLCKSLETHPNLIKFELSKVTLKGANFVDNSTVFDQTGVALGSLITANSSITVLKINHNMWLPSALTALADALKENKSIKTLNLSGTQVQIAENSDTSTAHKTVLHLLSCLSDNTTIQDLNLSHAISKSEGVEDVLMRLIKSNSSLTTLDISHNNISEQFLREVIKLAATTKEVEGEGEEGVGVSLKSLKANKWSLFLDMGEMRDKLRARDDGNTATFYRDMLEEIEHYCSNDFLTNMAIIKRNCPKSCGNFLTL